MAVNHLPTNANKPAVMPSVSADASAGRSVSGRSIKYPWYESMEKNMVKYCSPTLVGVKCGSMYRDNSDKDTIYARMEAINEDINPSGVNVINLGRSGRGRLIYVYRPRMVEARLKDPDVRRFLEEYGYDCSSCMSAIYHLRRRFSMAHAIPHESGIFLGYPLCDVIGFIENKGRNHKAVGCWKVYGDVDSANAYFNELKQCRDVALRQFISGMSMRSIVDSGQYQNGRVMIESAMTISRGNIQVF